MKLNVNWVILILFLCIITLFIVTDFSNEPQDSEEIGSFIVILLLLYFAFGYSPSRKQKTKTPKKGIKLLDDSKQKSDINQDSKIVRMRKSRFESDIEDL